MLISKFEIEKPKKSVTLWEENIAINSLTNFKKRICVAFKNHNISYGSKHFTSTELIQVSLPGSFTLNSSELNLLLKHIDLSDNVKFYPLVLRKRLCRPIHYQLMHILKIQNLIVKAVFKIQ